MCVTVPCCVVALPEAGTAIVACHGRRSTVSLLAADFVPEPGEWVLVHSGFVLARLAAPDVQELQDLTTGGTT